jgi:hypothetical protein
MQVSQSPQKFERPPFWNGSLLWHDLPTEFLKNLAIVSEVGRGGRQTHRQDGDLISLHVSFRNESGVKRLKIYKKSRFTLLRRQIG